MARETVQAVRRAELNAAEKETEALHQQERILAEAQQKAKALLTERIKKANEEAERKLSLANQQGAKRMEDMKKRVEKESILMKDLAQSKEENAIKLVLEHVVNGI